jgi:hypothetical protein
MKATAARPFVEFVEAKSEEHPWMRSTYVKVRQVVRRYATYKTASLKNIPLADLMNERGGLHPDLEQFINRIQRMSEQTPARHKQYKEEAKARLRRIIAALSVGVVSRRVKGGAPANDGIPDFMLPVIDAMSRTGGGWLQGQDEGVRLARRQLPLWNDDRLVLPILLQVAQKYELTTYEPLLLEHRLEVYQLIRETYPESKWDDLRTRVIKVRLKLGLKTERRKKAPMLSEFPPTLKKQCETYLKNAAVGLEEVEPQLADLARGYKVVVAKAEAKTLRATIRSIGTALSRMPSAAGQDISVEDMLRLTPMERYVRGRVMGFLGNAFVEELRAYERALVTKRKRAGLDSTMFQHYLKAFKTVAAYNGIFEYHDPLNAAYKVRLDFETTEAVKLAKKDAFDLPWIDGEIDRLGVEFRRICRDGSFKYGSLKEDGTERNRFEVRKVMRLCLFYVAFVTLRYMGYRQQCLRKCVFGVHIKFKGKSIHFSWKRDEVKNNKALTGILTRGRDDRLHKIFIDVLRDYHKYIYPYVVAQSGEALGGIFFVHHDLKGNFIPFDLDVAANFGTYFTHAVKEFLIFDGRLAAGARSLNPHFFRGLACDWLKEEGASNEAIAEYVGDHVHTIEAKYLKRNKSQDIRRAIDEAEETHFAKKRREREPALVSELMTELKSKTRMVETLTREITRANDKAAEQSKSYEEKVSRLEAQLSEERDQRARGHSELMETLKHLNNGQRSTKGKTTKR